MLFCFAHSFLQRVRIARNADHCTCQKILSLRLSVTFGYFVQINEDTIVRFSAARRTIIVVPGAVKFIRIFAGDHPSEGLKVRHSPVAS